ncbi:hypothetical protein Clacol_000012 [Clathrus columnatus]|uniref:F-box domain-containing protein n=1 Tax=Clathrus columnatus TaxID=1419009 RepID=A0AAV4ZYU4_9AGAM|nr:hypothetical protein Clacol_000012 [Clathrus columnatus]
MSILSTDYFPSAAEKSGILNVYNRQVEILNQLESEILNLMAKLKDLQTTRDHVLKLANANASLVAPIRRLSDRLLTRIFRYLPVYPSFVVTSVCKRWRATAISTPFLWTDIRYGQAPLLDFANMYRSFYVRLDNTFDKPLDLTINTCHYDNASQFHMQPHRLLSISQMARNQLHRCRTLNLHGFHCAQYLLFSHVRPPSLKRLRSLCINFQFGILEDPTIFTLDLPMLEEMKLVNPGNLLQHVQITPNLRKLRILTLHQCEPQDLAILSQCPNVVKLIIVLAFTGPQRSLILPSNIPFPHLTEFSINQGVYQGDCMDPQNDTVVSDILRRFESPRLTKLTLSLTQSCVKQTLIDFPSHPERLRTLRLEYLSECYHGGGDFQESESYYNFIWSVFPNVHTLIISAPFFCALSSGFVSSLVPRPTQQIQEWPCPNLQTLVLSGVIVESEITRLFYMRDYSLNPIFFPPHINAVFYCCYAKKDIVDALRIAAEDLGIVIQKLDTFYILLDEIEIGKNKTYPPYLIDAI